MIDRATIERASAGDRAAQRELYEGNVDRVYRVAFRLAGDEELARDFTQEAFIRAFQRLDDFRGEGDAAAAGGALNRWARDLLADTRLLLDLSAASDVRRRHLLEDLEMVLAQIVQPPVESSVDRALVLRSIERGAMLSRLRSTIPAGSGSGT